MQNFPWLSLVIFGPLLGAFAVGLIPRTEKRLIRNIALLSSLLVFVVSIPLVVNFDVFNGGFQLTRTGIEDVDWIPSLGIKYHVGVDGISLFIILLTTFLTPICILSTYKAVNQRVKEYMIALLVLEMGMLGALSSMDVFLFYVFWEVMLIPMYLIIGVWGGPRRVYAAVKFFIFTMVGSVLMLIALLYVYFQVPGEPSFNIEVIWATALNLSATEQTWLFLAFMLAFAIKVPLFPFHTWLPDAHVQAPTAGSVILAGVLLKMGTFGIVRYAAPMFPQALFAFAPWLAILSVIGIIYGALMAVVQRDIKALVAYSSVSHLGFVVLGIVAMTPEAITGSVFQMLAHGIATGGLFLCVGVLYERRHKRGLDDFGGVAKTMPGFAVMFVIIVLASAGLPGLNGFVGEFTILIGTAASTTLHFGSTRFYPFAQTEACSFDTQGMCLGPESTAYIFAIIAAVGVILAAVYLLRMVGRVLFGPLTHEENKKLKDLSMREWFYLLPIVLVSFFMGMFPSFFTDRIERSSERLINVYMHPGYDQRMERLLIERRQEEAAAADEHADLESSPGYQVVDAAGNWMPIIALGSDQ